MKTLRFIVSHSKLPLAFVAFLLAALAAQPYGFSTNPHFPNLVVVEPFASLALYAGLLALISELVDQLIKKGKEQYLKALIWFFVFLAIWFVVFKVVAPKVFVDFLCNGTVEGCFVLNYS